MPLNSRALIIVAVLAAATMFSTTSNAEEFIVGDDKGWTVGFDYKTWTANKIFQVGDKLVFKYPVGVHNVYSVNGADFKNCTVPTGVSPMTSGEDVVVLDSPGRRWYMCGVGSHCQNGQKIFINVSPQSPSPSPAPLSLIDLIPIVVASPPSSSSSTPSPSPSPWSWPWTSSSSKPAHHDNGVTTRFGWVPRKLINKIHH